MKKLIFTISLFILTAGTLPAQDITGAWNGVLDVMGNQLQLVFHIEKSDSGYSATFDSPDQGAKDIPFTSAVYDAPNLKLEANNIGVEYEATLEADSLIGTWNQGGRSFELDMSRNKIEKEKPKRPQYPKKPYPYVEEMVTIKNEADSLTLAATLTIPDKSGTYPAVILISGSGPQNRDEEVFGHKPFLVLADHLTRNGIAVLRYDDRGTALSTGNHNTATSKDFARDVLSAVKYLKKRNEIDVDNIGLIGHSEGGLVGSMNLVFDGSGNYLRNFKIFDHRHKIELTSDDQFALIGFMNQATLNTNPMVFESRLSSMEYPCDTTLSHSVSIPENPELEPDSIVFFDAEAFTHESVELNVSDFSPEVSQHCDFSISVEEINQSGELNIYPNPTNGSLTVKTESSGKSTFEVLDRFGRRVLIERTSTGSTQLNLSALPPGVYFLKVISEEGQTQIEKVVVAR